MEEKFGTIADFGEKVTLYRSMDRKQASGFFTYSDASDLYFDILIVRGNRRVYIKYPGTEHFIEMFGGTSGAHYKGKCGNQENYVIENVWEDATYKRKISLHVSDTYAFLKTFSAFDFLQVVTDLDTVFPIYQCKYLKLPTDVRGISYCFNLPFELNGYGVIDYPAFNFDYNNQRLQIVIDKSVQEWKITSFSRYRDGGTTIIEATDSKGDSHKLYFPSPWKKEAVPDFDGIEIEFVSDIKREELIKILSLTVLPDKDDSK